MDGARLDAMLSFPSQIKQALTNLRVGPPATIDDKDMTVVQGNGPNGTLATLYFDDSSGLLRAHGAAWPDRRSAACRLRWTIPTTATLLAAAASSSYRWTFAWLDGRDNFEFSDVKLNVPIARRSSASRP